MGYSTWYELEHDADEDTTAKIDERIKDDEDLNYAIGDGQNRCKWYDHDKDMLEMSLVYPDVTFILTGEGEDTPDFWQTKYKDGKMANVTGEVVYPEFGELS